jgi:glutaminase
MDYQSVLNEIRDELSDLPLLGKPATYIPDLARVDPDQFGIHICDLKGGHFFLGQNEDRFSIQSISKVFTLAMAFELEGEKLWERVGVEPSGTPFNSLVQLDYENGIPRNPLINAGAMVVADVLLSRLDDPQAELLSFVRKLANKEDIQFNEKVAASEREHGFRNSALLNLMKSFGNIENDIQDVLDFYFHQCSLEMSCRELAQSFLLFANHGKLPVSNEIILSVSKSKRINAIMQTCGFYDESGDFSFRVGLPGKSGVGGGIAANHPGYYSVVVWSPRLNKKGNSYRGVRWLELLTTKTGLSIF